MFVLQLFFWVLFIYGILSLIQDVLNEFTYKKLNHNMKIIILAKNLEENLNQFVVEFANIKRLNNYKKVTIIDLEENDDLDLISRMLESNEINFEVISKKEGKEKIDNYFEKDDISFF